jgi:hypothetical protein
LRSVGASRLVSCHLNGDLFYYTARSFGRGSCLKDRYVCVAYCVAYATAARAFSFAGHLGERDAAPTGLEHVKRRPCSTCVLRSVTHLRAGFVTHAPAWRCAFAASLQRCCAHLRAILARLTGRAGWYARRRCAGTYGRPSCRGLGRQPSQLDRESGLGISLATARRVTRRAPLVPSLRLCRHELRA